MGKPILLALIDAEGKPVATLGLTEYDGRTVVKRDGTQKVLRFPSGGLGFQISSKVEIEGKRYQLGCNVVEIKNQVNGMVKQFSAEQIEEMNRQREQTEQHESGELTEAE